MLTKTEISIGTRQVQRLHSKALLGYTDPYNLPSVRYHQPGTEFQNKVLSSLFCLTGGMTVASCYAAQGWGKGLKDNSFLA